MAHAQFGGPTNRANSGGFGQQSVSNGAFGSRTLGGSSIGTPNRSAMGGQTSMFGGGGGAGGGMAQGSGSAGNQIGSQQISGNEWFVPGNRQAGQFVGSDSQDAANFIGAFSQLTGVNQGGQMGRGQTGRGQMGMNQFGGNQFGQGQRGTQRGQQNFGQGGRQQGRVQRSWPEGL